MKLDSDDWMVVAAIVLLLLCHATTQFIITKSTTCFEDKELVEKAITMFEANPITEKILLLNKVKFIITYVLLPGFVGGLYYFFKKKYPHIKAFVGSTFLLIAVLNICNDLAVLLGVLAR